MGRFLLMGTALYKFIMETDFIKKLNSGTPMILDGAYGTMLMKYCQSGIVDQLNLDAPELVSYLHQAYIEAGAEIIKTNTFNCCDPRCFESQRQKEIIAAGMEIARGVSDKYSSSESKIFVAGSIGSTSIRLSIEKSVNKPKFLDFRTLLTDSFQSAANSMAENGCDMILIETVIDIETMTAALDGIEKYRHDSSRIVPIAVSLTLDPLSQTFLSGNTLDEVMEHISTFNVDLLGLNCIDIREIEKIAIALREKTDKPLIISSNLGVPDRNGQYEISPTKFANHMIAAACNASASIIGGCCGTTPAHIRALPASLRQAFR